MLRVNLQEYRTSRMEKALKYGAMAAITTATSRVESKREKGATFGPMVVVMKAPGTTMRCPALAASNGQTEGTFRGTFRPVSCMVKATMFGRMGAGTKDLTSAIKNTDLGRTRTLMAACIAEIGSMACNMVSATWSTQISLISAKANGQMANLSDGANRMRSSCKVQRHLASDQCPPQ